MKISLLTISCLGAILVLSNRAEAVPTAPPRLAAIRDGGVELAESARRLLPGEQAGDWTLMAVAAGVSGEPQAVFEDFTSLTGGLALVDAAGSSRIYPKSAEPTYADPGSLYRGHSLQEVRNSDHDLLGAEILAEAGDPSYAAVASCLAPIRRMETYSFVGTPWNPDKVGVSYGGRTGNFDPAVHVPAIRKIRDEGRVVGGLLGGWLPVLRFVYPEKEGDWSEMLMFAPLRSDNANPVIQPVWYRVCRVEGGKLKWAKYFDSYAPFPPRPEASAAAFYGDLRALHAGWERMLAPALRIELPDRRLADLTRHSLVRAMMTRVNSFPKYGVLDRNYGGAEHDGFQDTFNVDTTAMLAWGLFGQARDYVDNYLTHFVRDDGSIVYRGPETGQYGRMLTVLAEYANLTGDDALLRKHRARIDAVTRLLLALRRTAQQLPRENPAHGLIAGWCEADSCLEADPGRYHQPYFSNSAEAARGLGDLGAVWERIGRKHGQDDLSAWGSGLRREALELGTDLRTALARSRVDDKGFAWLPAIAGAKELPHTAAVRDGADPQFRAYRAYMEMLFSGVLPRSDAENIVRYREAHRDMILGIPTAYGYNSTELAGFLSYGHAFGLLQHDLVREYLLELHGLAAHQYTRGTWTAPETRLINPADTAAPYCGPAQLAVPLLVRWMLAFEDPATGALWLGKALPRDWLEHGKAVAATGIPTCWGRLDLRIESRFGEGSIAVELQLPERPPGQETRLRLRAPGARPIKSVTLAGKPWTDYDPAAETVTIPASATGKVLLTVRY